MRVCRGKWQQAMSVRPAGLDETDLRGVADDLPDPLSLVLGMNKETLAHDWIDADAETLETGVTDVAGGLAGPEGVDPGPCEMCCDHRVPLAIELQTRANSLVGFPIVAE